MRMDNLKRIFNEMQPENARKRRAAGRARNMEHLEASGLKWRELCGGAILIFGHPWPSVEFYPGTGVWRPKGGRALGGGAVAFLEWLSRQGR